jgi:hypothetical protein
MTEFNGFRGAAKRLDDLDLPRLGARLGVGEDEIHAFLDVETRGHGFDAKGRPIILFEPHIFYRQLPKAARAKAVNAGLAYSRQGEKPYPADSYPRLIAAMKIDEDAALKSASWGLGQVLGVNYKDAGYPTVQQFVMAMMDDEEKQLEASVNFILANKLDDELRAHDWAGFAKGYNGSGYAKNRYDAKLADAFRKWSRIKDTPWQPVPVVVPVAPTPEPAKPDSPQVVVGEQVTVPPAAPVVVTEPVQDNPPAAPTVVPKSKKGWAVLASILAAIAAAIARYFGG